MPSFSCPACIDAVDLVNLVVANQVPDGRRRHQDLERARRGPCRRPAAAAPDRRCLRARATAACGSATAGSAGKMSMMRLIVCAAEFVCSVPNVRWPVSAIFSAASTVSRSRISPMRTMSGSSRSAARSALREAVGVAVHLALVDQAVLVLVDVLDRILDGEDVLVALGVDLVDHRRQRRRLAAAGRPGDEHQPARPLGERAPAPAAARARRSVRIFSGISR